MAKKPNPFAKAGKPSKAEVAKMGKKGAAKDEKSENPFQRMLEAKKGKK